MGTHLHGHLRACGVHRAMLLMLAVKNFSAFIISLYILDQCYHSWYIDLLLSQRLADSTAQDHETGANFVSFSLAARCFWMCIGWLSQPKWWTLGKSEGHQASAGDLRYCSITSGWYVRTSALLIISHGVGIRTLCMCGAGTSVTKDIFMRTQH